jgi:glycosyltransferase involved in cell wall biosynthesis
VSVAVTVVAYEAEGFIEALLGRIPDTVAGEVPLILVSDDASTDRTAELAEAWAAAHPGRTVHVRRSATNQGYGGNQKTSYRWAEELGADIAVLLHGDEQYPPELIERLVVPIQAGEGDVVFGSRMMERGAARAGGMPMERFVGNKVLTRALNLLAGQQFTEWFSGFRAYRVGALSDIDLDALSDGFDFDVMVTLELLKRGVVPREVPIPTHYGEEISRVPLMKFGTKVLRHGWRARRQGLPSVTPAE